MLSVRIFKTVMISSHRYLLFTLCTLPLGDGELTQRNHNRWPLSDKKNTHTHFFSTRQEIHCTTEIIQETF